MAGALLAPMQAMAWKLPTVPDRERAQSAGFLLRARGSELPRLPAGERGRPLLTGLLPQARAPAQHRAWQQPVCGPATAGLRLAAVRQQAVRLLRAWALAMPRQQTARLLRGRAQAPQLEQQPRTIPAPSGVGPAMARQQTLRSSRAQALAMPRQGTLRLLKAQASAMPERLEEDDEEGEEGEEEDEGEEK